MTFTNFIGKTITKVYINLEHTVMLWLVEDQVYQFYAEGDCCSYSWFEHCDGGEIFKTAN